MHIETEKISISELVFCKDIFKIYQERVSKIGCIFGGFSVKFAGKSYGTYILRLHQKRRREQDVFSLSNVFCNYFW
jgi:hypothetical protein